MLKQQKKQKELQPLRQKHVVDVPILEAPLPANDNSLVDQLKALVNLHASGALSADEFEAAKRLVLHGPSSDEGKQKEKPATRSYLDNERVRDRSKDAMFLRVTNSFWPEFDGLYHPTGAWDGMPQWAQLSSEDVANQRVPAHYNGGPRNGIWWRREGHWRMGRRNHYFFIADGDKKGTYPPVGASANWEAAYGFYERIGKKAIADKYCKKPHHGHSLFEKKKAVGVQLAWEYPFGHPSCLSSSTAPKGETH